MAGACTYDSGPWLSGPSSFSGSRRRREKRMRLKEIGLYRFNSSHQMKEKGNETRIGPVIELMSTWTGRILYRYQQAPLSQWGAMYPWRSNWQSRKHLKEMAMQCEAQIRWEGNITRIPWCSTDAQSMLWRSWMLYKRVMHPYRHKRIRIQNDNASNGTAMSNRRERRAKSNWERRVLTWAQRQLADSF